MMASLGKSMLNSRRIKRFCRFIRNCLISRLRNLSNFVSDYMGREFWMLRMDKISIIKELSFTQFNKIKVTIL
jgi:hypothetical protein